MRRRLPRRAFACKADGPSNRSFAQPVPTSDCNARTSRAMSHRSRLCTRPLAGRRRGLPRRPPRAPWSVRGMTDGAEVPYGSQAIFDCGGATCPYGRAETRHGWGLAFFSITFLLARRPSQGAAASAFRARRPAVLPCNRETRPKRDRASSRHGRREPRRGLLAWHLGTPRPARPRAAPETAPRCINTPLVPNTIVYAK